MKKLQLGKTDLQVSPITFGCWELGGGPWEFTSDETNVNAIKKALELGIQTFDTAEAYGKGHSEQIVAQALAGVREQCVIATKVSPRNLRAADVRNSAENSLRRLNTDYIDIYYVHWPNPEIPIKETLSEFNKLKDEKLIRAIGLSNFSIDQLKEAAQYAQIDVIQPEYSLLHRTIEPEILPYCIEHNIGVASYSSIAKGILTGAFHDGRAVLKDDDFRKTESLLFFRPESIEKEAVLIDALKEIAERKKVSISQIAISWLLHQRGLTTAIIGTQSEKHLIDNALSTEVSLSADELQHLSEISLQVIESL